MFTVLIFGIITSFILLILSVSYFYWNEKDQKISETSSSFHYTAVDVKDYEAYKTVYNRIASKLETTGGYDDGTYAPILLRLAWHSSATYDSKSRTGGSGTGSMRFKAESNTEANKGLEIAKHFLESIHDDFPWVSYGDLYTLGGVVAIQEMSGPLIAWRPGRNDLDESFIPPDGRLPDANKDESHIRQIFGRLGLSIQETVALLGAHGVGRCHSDRSGFDGPWTTSTIEFGNDFYLALLDEVWTPRKWSGPKQFRNLNTLLMMLPTDMSLLKDPEFRNWVTIYAKNEYQFFRDFSKAFSKLIELGVSFSTDSEPWNFAPLHGFRPYQSPNECKMTFQD